MKITKSLLTIVIAVTSFFFTGCKKNNDSAPGIKYKLQTANRSSVISRTTSGNIQWTSGYGSATEIKFEAESNSHEVEFKSQVPQRIDLFSGIVNLGNITLPAGIYNEVEFKIELNPTTTDPSLQLNGQFTSGGVTTPVIFKVNNALEIETEKKNVVITDNSSYTALTTLDLSLLTRGVTETMLNNAVRTNGVIVISLTSNTQIYNIIVNNILDADGVDFEND